MTAARLKTGDAAPDFEVYDTPNGDISGYPDVKLNQFGFNVYMPNDICSCSSIYDADLIKDMKIRVVYTNNTASDVEIGINLMLHEVRIT